MAEFDTQRILRGVLAAFLFVLILAMFPWTPEPAVDVKVLIYHWTALLLALVTVPLMYMERRPVRYPRWMFWPFLVFVLINLLSALFSSHVWNSAAEVSRLISLFTLFLLSTQLYTAPSQIRRLCLVLCSAVAVSSVYALAQRLGFDPFPWKESQLALEQYTNLPGTFGNPNVAGHVLILTIVSALYLSRERGLRWCLGFAAICLAHLVATSHRAGFVSLFAVAVLLGAVWFAGKSGTNPRRALQMSLAAVVAAGAIAITSVMATSNTSRGGPMPLDASLLLRYNSFHGAVSMIADRPILGFGPGNFRLESPPYWTGYEQWNYATGRLVNLYVHNEPLQAAVDAGLAAALLFLFILIVGMVRGLHMAFFDTRAEYRRLGLFYGAFFLAYLVDGLFGFNFHAPVSGVLLVLMAGALAALSESSTPQPRTAPGGFKPLAWRVAVIALLILNAGFGTRIFLTQFWLQQGDGAMAWERFDDADARFATGGRLVPWDWRFPYRRGLVCRALGDDEGAIAYFERGLEQHPQSIPLLIGLARSHFDRASTASGEAWSEGLVNAERYAQRSLGLCTPLPEALDTLGRIALLRAVHYQEETGDVLPGGLERLSESEQYLRGAVAAGASKTSEIFRLLADVQVLKNRPQAAEAEYIRALRAAPFDFAVWRDFYSFSTAFRRYSAFEERASFSLQRPDASLENLAELRAHLSVWLAEIEYLGHSDVEGALREYAQAVRDYPRYAQVWKSFAGFATETGKLPLLKRWLADACNRIANTGEPVLPVMKAAVLADSEEVHARNESVDFLARAFRDFSAQPLRIAPTESAGHELRWAGQLVYSALSSDSFAKKTDGSALATLGAILAKLNLFDEADKTLAQAVSQLSGESAADAIVQRVEVLAHLERWNQARELLLAHLSQHSERVNFRLSLARVFAESGKPGRARLEYSSILREFQFDPENRRMLEEEIAALATD